jgi:hypothetical protein
MTDELPPHTPDTDELASAYLDAELDPLERARVEADEHVRARVAELAEVRDLVAAPVAPLAPDRREEMIRAALEAAVRDGEPPTAPVVPLEGRRRHRVLRVLAPAAAAAAAIGAVAFLARDDPKDDAGTAARTASVEEDTAATILAGPAVTEAPAGVEAEQATEAADGSAELSVPTAAAATGAPVDTAPAAAGSLAAHALTDLGEVSTPAELVARLQQRNSDGVGPATDTAQDVIAPWDCPDQPGTLIGIVVYTGERALVVSTDGSRYAVLDQDCRILATVSGGS